MQVKRLPTNYRYVIAASAEAGITAEWMEKRSMYCERAKKQMLRHAKVPERLRTESAGSARDAFAMYEELGLVMPRGTVAQIGDILYWVEDGDGRYGHVGIKYSSTRFAENSSVHTGPEDFDARGWRFVARRPGYRVVRLWETP